MLVETYNLEIEASTHSAHEFEYEAIAQLPVDIREVLPYLNARLRNGTYLADVPAFSWRRDEHKIAFWPDRIAVDHLESREQAEVVIEELVKLVNDVWDERSQIVPETTSRENLQPLELYRLLPRTNCKKCGEASCFNFALKLAAGQIEVQKCESLFVDAEYEDQRLQIESLLTAKRALL
jgi:ArsR family metal-binding transcriptional regulator